MSEKRRLARANNIADLRALARRRLPGPMFHYIDGGSDDEINLSYNTEAFENWELIPRYLVDVSSIDTSTRVLGQDIAWPVMLAPTGMSRLFHPDGERAVARAADKAGTVYSLSTVASTSIEQVAEVCPGPKMFQIYVLRDADLNREFIERCKAADYAALCLTIDLPAHGNRERDLVTGMTLPPSLTLKSLLDIALHYRWAFDHITSPTMELANVAGRIEQGKEEATTLKDFVSQQFDPSVTWDDAAAMMERWDGPFAVKGILCVDDALRAADIGATAVILSNHGGRQLDGVPAPIDLLPEVVAAVGDRVEVIMDSGIRRGTHVIKALALGAKACMVGRAYLYGLGAAGQAGVERALEMLRIEIERDMKLLGCCSVADIGRQHVRRRP
jgi:L-lactate dehydrogenase (cytochrome)